ncbi:unnamed protein product [Plutella xylostella]|uniref:(diamondback moth) hypothetical protein n=1 Tax=Plutella xylostella TaxID=51655 RepID=A0A8S4GCS6_PLUXY|nr:unnamed protein product [Plutella xylostella]
MDEQQAVRESFEDKYYQSIAKAKYLLQKHSTSARITDHSVADQTIRESQADSSEAIKYPDISLPTFSGDVSEWVEFRATYDALINQSNLKPIQKYKYLRSCLKGSALEAIGSLEFSDEGYAIAWQLLCERYNNPKILVNNHLRALFNVDKVPSNPSALRALVDNISKHLRTLKSLNVSTENWDVLIIFFLSCKLDKNLQTKWEEKTNSCEIPSLQEFKTFLRSRADLLETMNQLQPADHANRTSASEKAMVTTARDHSEPNKVTKQPYVQRNQCPQCNETHNIKYCTQFLALNPIARIRAAKRHRLCTNCLRSNHALPNCHASKCIKCSGKHHTLLHIVNNQPYPERPTTQSPQATQSTQPVQPSTLFTPQTEGQQSINLQTNQTNLPTEHTPKPTQGKQVFLSTAVVNVADNQNKLQSLRILLDSGSQSCYITERAYKTLSLPKYDTNTEVLGFNNSVTNVKHLCNVTIHSRTENFSLGLSCLIVPNICTSPSHQIGNLKIPKRFKLADDRFYSAGDIDMIVGVEKFYDLLSMGRHELGHNLPILRKTRLGWIVTGSTIEPTQLQTRCNFIQDQMKIIWETEGNTKLPNDDIKECERSFKTHTRDSDGRFVVSLPLKEDPSALGNSKHIAYKRFKSLENKFDHNPKYKQNYVQFMSEFKGAGRMIESKSINPKVYLPHHAVINPEKITTPVRVVFDASCSTDTDDFPTLTPAHFLIGRSYTSLADYDFQDTPKNKLNHYQQLQQIQQDFWRRWSQEYLGLLQQRTKWRSSKGAALAVGTVVVVKDDRLPPCQWKLGRITKTHDGQDGEARVAVVQTSKGLIKRAFNKICPLPISLTEETD